MTEESINSSAAETFYFVNDDLITQNADLKPVNRATPHLKHIGDSPAAMGGSADIWKVKLHTQETTSVFVALKVFFPPCTGMRTTMKRFNHELKCCLHLLPGHPHISPLLGFQDGTTTTTTPRLIFLWYSNGPISEYLNTHPAMDPLSLILEVTSGIQFMHERSMVHGDLKSANIMIDDFGHARIIDFGLSRILSDTVHESVYHPSGTSLCWCAPELLIEGALRTKSSDIYAWGSTILELLTGSHPYASLPTLLGRYAAVRSGASPREFAGPLRRDVSDPARVWRLLEWCWDEAGRRPKVEDMRRVVEGWGSII